MHIHLVPPERQVRGFTVDYNWYMRDIYVCSIMKSGYTTQMSRALLVRFCLLIPEHYANNYLPVRYGSRLVKFIPVQHQDEGAHV